MSHILKGPSLPPTWAVLALAFGGLAACDSPTGVVPESPIAIAAGGFHTCVVSPAGTTRCWGQNTTGELGNGNPSFAEGPVTVAGNGGYASVTGGQIHSCALTTSGLAYCWGSNGGGRLGDPAVGFSPVPRATTGSLLFRSLSAGGSHTCGVTMDDLPFCWGANGGGQLGVRDAVASCGIQACAPVPVRVAGELLVSVIASGLGHSCAVTTDEVSYCWGTNADGQLGNGTLGSTPLPVLVQSNLRFVRVGAGGSHSCGLTRDGSIYCWGADDRGQLGTGDREGPCAVTGAPCAMTPVRTESPFVFVSLTVGLDHACGITRDLDAYCWGANRSGQVGNGDVFDVAIPLPVEGGHKFQSIAAGGQHSCGVTVDLDVFCWGDNFRGQIGQGTTGFRRSSPVFVMSLAGS